MKEFIAQDLLSNGTSWCSHMHVGQGHTMLVKVKAFEKYFSLKHCMSFELRAAL